MEIALSKGRVTGPIALVALSGLILAAVAVATGTISTLGYENRHVTFHGVATGTSVGGGFGLKDMFFFKGQTFYARYDTEVLEGSFRIALQKTFGSFRKKPRFSEYISKSSSGEVTWRIPETGLYFMVFEGSVLGGRRGAGYNVKYSVEWGVR